MLKDGKYFFQNCNQAQDFFKNILKKCKVQNPESLEKAIEMTRKEGLLNTVIVICMNCDMDKEQEFEYEIEEEDHRLVCIIM